MSPVQPQPGTAAGGGGTNSATSSDRGLLAHRRQDLTLPLPQRDSSLAVPLPLAPCSSNSSSPSANSTPSSNQSNGINFSELERANRVGSGTYGTAYKVIHRPTGRVYALKVIHGNHEDSVRRQICREIEILRDVNNPNVVKCHDMLDDNGEIQVLLEFMDGGSLEGTHIPDEPQLADLARQILTGLADLHCRHIVHRDIKPSNILINSRRQVKIADFGVGRILAQTMDPCNSSGGTIAYMSPEEINTDLNHGGYDGYAADIWSFGVSILEFYMGRFPFAVGRQGDWASLMCAICMSQPPEAPPTASTECRDFISCCLQREPRRRWNALRLLRHPFILSNTQAQNHQLLPPPRSIDSQLLGHPSSVTNTPAQNQNVSRHVLSCGGGDGGGSGDDGNNDNGGGGGGVDKINLSSDDDDESNSCDDDDNNDGDFKSWMYEGQTSVEDGTQLAKRHGGDEGDGNLESKTYPHIRQQPSISVRWYHYRPTKQQAVHVTGCGSK